MNRPSLYPRFDEPRLLSAQMELIDNSFGIAMLGCFLASVLLATGIIISTGTYGIILWTACMGLACAFGHFGRNLLPDRISEAHATRYARSMTALLTGIGGLWGVAGWFYMDLRFPPTAICLLAMIAGMSAAALAIFSPCLPVAVGFFLPAILPVWTVFLATKSIYYLPMFLGVPLYLLVLLVFAHNYSRVARRSIQLRFANSELVEQLRQQTNRTEQALRHAEEANRAKSVFLASASHDLRQPLHALGLFIVSLARTPLTDKQHELLGHIEASSGAAREMLNTLLDFSKLEAGVIKAHPRELRLQPMLRKLENEFAPQADSKQLIYRVRDTVAVTIADPGLLEIILRNLIANAIRYTERGGILIGCRRRTKYLSLEVWDTGIGVPASQQRDIFREFHQLGNPERDRRKGLGLGLAIVDGLAQTMGLQIDVASTQGRGSVFRVRLPLSDEPHVEFRNLTVPLDTFSLCRLRVLVIDDDLTVRTAVSELLDGWECPCMAVESEQEAVVALADFVPDLVIADYRLRSNRTGQEALGAIHAYLGRPLPAIILTGDTAPDRLREAQATGAILLHKPVEAETLRLAMMQLATASATHDPALPPKQQPRQEG
ncbi:ATP-binding response regulator [Vogesella alkaliphila]|uniref:histidine kinase n=1 Tax=Vogesella alkaliphila TaxID=1193621 RepID=A0ABQ2YF86_9NEIS|nr:hybrid sensor histidine kinase/response regulator [Vogesella alkaliphila]GGX80957.1 hybrid sensor histidine kinase/response regulator [Vogesella alkaliphila]